MNTVRVTGAEDVERRIREQKNQFMRRTEKAVYDQLARVAARSTELVPVDTGKLKDSVYVRVSKAARYSDHVRGEAGYTTDYAETVHERVEVPHRVGQAKFLETAWLEEIPGALIRMADFISRARAGFGLSSEFSTPGGG